MIRICAWCQQEGPLEIQLQSSHSSADLISHGICRNHAQGLRRTYGRDLLRQPVSPSSPRSRHTSTQTFS